MTTEELIAKYAQVVGTLDKEAMMPGRSYGGHLRKTKGALLEDMTDHMVRLAWKECGGLAHRLTLGDVKTFRVYVQSAYVSQLPAEVKEYVERTANEHYFRAQVDKHVFVDGEFVLGIECKAYAENAMLKRILIDFRMLKSLFPRLGCCLLQLESMLGGTYANPGANPQLGSPPSHTLMSYFPEVRLHIVTLLEGERKVDRPIHKPEYFKELKPENLDNGIRTISDLLQPFA